MDKNKIKEVVRNNYCVVNEDEANSITFAKAPDYTIEINGSESDNKGLIMYLYKNKVLLDKAVNVKINEISSILSLFENGIKRDLYYYPYE